MRGSSGSQMARIGVLVADFAEEFHHTRGNFPNSLHPISSVLRREITNRDSTTFRAAVPYQSRNESTSTIATIPGRKPN